MTSPHPTTTTTTLPLVFSDGDRQIDAGSVPIHPSLSFPKFQSLVAHKFGLAPHQISTSLVRSKKSRNNLRRKTPLDDSTDFAALSKERDCFVLALLRRPSRRSRRRPSKNSPPPPVFSPPTPVILRRADPPPSPVAEGLGFWDYGSQLRYLQRQRERYLLTMNYSYPREIDFPKEAAVCEECEAAKEEGRSSEFHSCVYDKVTVGFRSSVGPIERPPKTIVG